MKKQWRLLNESEHYRQGKFMNLSETPMLAKGVSFRKILYDYFRRPSSATPSQPLPSVKTDLHSLQAAEPIVVWFGHSSYLIHCRGINILVDPVFSGHASPIPGMVKAFPGANVYGAADMPVIDLLIITHDHYDHLDRKTIARLKSKIRAVYTPLGVGKTIAGCGIDAQRITEMDWWETGKPLPQIELTATPARHFSGRGLKRAGSLWASFVLQLYGHTLFIGGDSGYDTHFKKIGQQYGPFDIAMLECGQYNASWPYIHMQPEETAQAAVDLQAKLLLPVHWAKFTLANHPWNEPVQRLMVAAERLHLAVATPRIGEPVTMHPPYPQRHWWL